MTRKILETETFGDIIIRDYKTEDQDGVIELYQEVFAEPPWNEYRKCGRCDINYGIGEIEEFEWYNEGCGTITKEISERLKSRDDCKNCGADMTLEIAGRPYVTRYFTNRNLKEYWSDEDVLDDINFCFKQKNPIFLVAEVEYPRRSYRSVEYEQEIVGFRWAYELPLKKFPFLSKIVNSGEAVYGDELAVKKKFRNKNLGSKMMEISFDVAKELRYKYFVGRTDIKSKMVPLYEKLGYENTGITDPQYPTRFYFIKRL